MLEVTGPGDSAPVARQAAARTFLFLQGLATPFFVDLARALIARGHRALRINLSLGDQLLWNLPATSYRGGLAGWRSYLTGFLSEHAVTDIVLFGDCRPYHRVAISLAAHRRVQVHVFEEGYLRPHWITVERGGVNGYSSLPRNPEVIRALAAGIEPQPEKSFQSSFVRRALWDVAYNFAVMAGRPLFPRFRRHRPNHVLIEYAGWLGRFMRDRKMKRIADAEVERVTKLAGGFFLVPLQLDSDYQVRVHSRFTDLGEFMEEVCASFAEAAPPETELLVKVHPLDNGLTDRRSQVAAIAERHGVASRVTCIEGGHLPTLLEATRGVIVINSTVGNTALEVGRPVIALGNSIYNLPGLSFQHGLDRFWHDATPPDPELFAAFRKLVVHRTQINGGYFSREGVAMAVEAAADRLEAVQPILQFFAVRAEEPSAGPLFAGPEPAE